jgi:uncharacterized protein (DUF302 family)
MTHRLIRLRYKGLFLFLFLLLWLFAVSGCGTIKAIQNAGPGAGAEAMRMWGKWVDSEGDIAVAATWERKVNSGVTVQEIEQAFASVAAEDNVKMVGEFFVSRELEARSGKPERFLKIYSFCNPLLAKEMVAFSPHMAAFLPCRIAVLEKEDGLWIYTMNMDMLIKMGRQLPPELETSALRMRQTLQKMLEKGAQGDF